MGPTTSVQRGYGIGEQFHRPPKNSIHVGGHTNNRASTAMSVGSNGTKPPTTVSVPPQHGSGLDETLGEDYQMDYKSTNIEEEDDKIWDIITNIHGELEYIQNLKKRYGELLPQLN